MFWRILSALIVLFWALMTGLIIRDTYFPDHSRFAVVPSQYVLDLFLTEAAAFNNTLHLYHCRERIGHTTFAIRRQSEEGAPLVYALLATGSVNLPGEGAKPSEASFRLNAELAGAERWQGLDLEVRAIATKMHATLSWKEGEKLPAVEVKQGDQIILNTEILQTMMAIQGIGAGGKFDWLTPMLKARGAAGGTPALQAREGVMDLAGRQRRCYIITLQIMQMTEVRAFFTEVGELARIELPQDYRLIEPMMHGLEPGMNTME